MDNINFVDAVLICHSENCENKDLEIYLTIAKDYPSVCGPCGIQIEDVTLVGS